MLRAGALGLAARSHFLHEALGAQLCKPTRYLPMPKRPTGLRVQTTLRAVTLPAG